MAGLDASIQLVLFYYILPLCLLFAILFYYFGVSKATLEAWLFNRFCSWIHRKFCDKQKELLFRSLPELKNRSKGSFNLLEIGVGSGMNFSFYPGGTKVTCVEPNPNHEYYVNKRLKKAKTHVRIVKFVQCFAESMPEIESDSYDAVVCTLTLCTVRDPKAVLKEVKRVLKPGGTFFYLEHIAAQQGTVTRWIQDRLQLIWPYFSGGCSLNRETWTYLDKAQFDHVEYIHYTANTWFGFFARFLLYGTAVKQ